MPLTMGERMCATGVSSQAGLGREAWRHTKGINGPPYSSSVYRTGAVRVQKLKPLAHPPVPDANLAAMTEAEGATMLHDPNWGALLMEHQTAMAEMRAMQQTREQSVLEQAKAFREREASFHARETSFQEREKALQEREASLHARETSFQEREKKEQEKLQKSLRERDDQLRRREERLQAEQTELQAREKEALSIVSKGTTRGGSAGSTSTSGGATIVLTAGGSGGGKDQVKKHRQEHDLNNVPELVESYQETGGQVPLAVLVEEVEALQQATTRVSSERDLYQNQFEQIQKKRDLVQAQMDRAEKDGRFVGGLKTRIDAFQKRMCELEDNVQYSEEQHAQLLERFKTLRDLGIERFVPLLLQTVHEFDARFEQLCRERPRVKKGESKRVEVLGKGEDALLHIESLCLELSYTKGRMLRQRTPTKHEPKDSTTLIELMRTALDAGPELERLANDAIHATQRNRTERCELIKPSKPTKGLQRTVQKVQEEYEGDYTRILDYVRISILVENLPDLAVMLEWFLHPDRYDRFIPLRTKDRISRNAPWDSELSGGNRDVMLNGLLQLGAGVEFIVEVQFHVRALFELKHDLHVLYAGSRVLGAMDDVMVMHEGIVTKEVLDRMERKVLRKLVLTFTKMSRSERSRIEAILQTEPCSLLEIDVSYSSVITDDVDDDGLRWHLMGQDKPEDGEELDDPKLKRALTEKYFEHKKANESQDSIRGSFKDVTAGANGEARKQHATTAKEVVLVFNEEEWRRRDLSRSKPAAGWKVNQFVEVDGDRFQPAAATEPGFNGVRFEELIEGSPAEASGLTWEKLTVEETPKGVELKNDKLKQALAHSEGAIQVFDKQQLNSFCISENVHVMHFIEAGGRYFRPKEAAESVGGEQGKAEELGLRWQYVGKVQPDGKELNNSRLAEALAKQTLTKFTNAQWEKFGILDLQEDDWIQWKSNEDTYFFQPDTSRGFIRYGTRTIACRRLRSLALSATGLCGVLPHGLSQCRGLKTLQLGGNKIEGKLPEEWFEYLVHLEWLNLADNQLEGEIPSNIGRCVSLQKLYLQGNQLTGPLPKSINSLRSLQALMIFNQTGKTKLCGPLPEQLTFPKMQLFLAFGNEFTGTVPAALMRCGLDNAHQGEVKIDLTDSQLDFPVETQKLFRDRALTWTEQKPLLLTRAKGALALSAAR